MGAFYVYFMEFCEPWLTNSKIRIFFKNKAGMSPLNKRCQEDDYIRFETIYVKILIITFYIYTEYYYY